MPTMIRREQRSTMSMISLSIAARLGARPLGPRPWTLAHWGAGRSALVAYVGAGWRGMPARAICCEPDSGKGSRQAIHAVPWQCARIYRLSLSSCLRPRRY